jgi:hypothetical protein
MGYRKTITKIAGWTGIPLIFSFIPIVPIFLIGFFSSQYNYYTHYKDFKKIYIKVDTLDASQPKGGGGQATFHGITKYKNKTLKIYHGAHYTTTFLSPPDPIPEMFKKNNKYFNIWYHEESGEAYFVEPELEVMTFATVWIPDLRRLSIFFFFFLFHHYCQYVRKKYELENKNSVNEENEINEKNNTNDEN